MAELVAMPISRGATDDCTASVSGCMVLPKPRPKMAMKVISCHQGVSAPILESSSIATAMRPTPMIGKIRR